MVTAAAVAMANRLPVLLLAGDTFANRLPDPVLQQVEHFGDPTITVNDAFKPVTRYWDRITRPEQIISSLPQAVATMLDPADCGPAFIGLCPGRPGRGLRLSRRPSSRRRSTASRARGPTRDAIREAAKLLRKAKKPLIIAGGGVHYSLADEALAAFAEKHSVPVAETITGRTALVHDHPMNVGPIGIIGSTSANALAAEADVVLAVGTRLQDFTTGSWTVFGRRRAHHRLNAARFDATKHRSLAVVGDALVGVEELVRGAGRLAGAGQLAEARRQGIRRLEHADRQALRRRPTPRCRATPRSSARSTASATRPISR